LIELREGQRGSAAVSWLLPQQHQAQQQQHRTLHMLCLITFYEVHRVIFLYGLLRLSADFLEEPYVKSLLKKW
jgi:hypothetical protein